MFKKFISLIIPLFLSHLTFGGAITIKGIVLNENNTPLQYVSIGIVNTTTGTVSNKDGSFTLIIDEDQISENDTLRFSMIGYRSKSFPVTEILNNANLNIVLTEKVEKIPEAVIVERKIKNKN